MTDRHIMYQGSYRHYSCKYKYDANIWQCKKLSDYEINTSNTDGKLIAIHNSFLEVLDKYRLKSLIPASHLKIIPGSK